MSLMTAGQYVATTKGLSPYYRKGGQLSVAVKVVTDADIEILARVNIELNDGTISDASMKSLRKTFPSWDGTVEGLFVESNFIDIPCSITVEDQVNQESGKVYSVVKWLNPPGGGMTVDMPELATKQELMAKYGARFRALSGGVKPKTAPKSEPKQDEFPPEDETPTEEEKKSEPPKAKTPAKKSAPVSKKAVKAPTMEECWDALLKRNPDQAETLWEKFITEAGGDKDYDKITGPEWIAIMALCDGTNSLE